VLAGEQASDHCFLKVNPMFTKPTKVALACAGIFATISTAQAQTSSELNPIIITATKYQEDAQKVPAFVTHITKKQIEESGATTVNEVIMRIAGIPGRPSLNGGNEFTLDLLGFGDNAAPNTVIVIDGIPFKEGDQSEIRISGIPIEHVESIEIQRGASSVLYGDGAVAGVINIVTKASSTNLMPVTSASLYMGYGTYESSEYRANALHSKDGLTINFSGLDRKTDGYRVNSGSNQQSGTLNTQYQFESFRAGISFDTDSLNARTPGSLTLAQFNSDPRQAQGANYLNDYGTNRVNRISTFFETDINSYNVKLNLSKRDREVAFYSSRYSRPNELTTSNKFADLAIKKLTDLGYGKNNFVAGVEVNNWSQYRINQFGNYDFDTDTFAIFLKNDIDLKESGTRLSAGLRRESLHRKARAYDNYYANTNSPNIKEDLTGWELGASKAIDLVNTIYSRIARSYRLPNVDEIGCVAINFCGEFPSLNSLASQTSIDKEFGWKYKLSELGRFGSRVYRSDLDNEIYYDPSLYANINLPPTRREGIDFDLYYKPINKVSVYGLFSLRDAKFLTGQYAGKDIPMSPKQVASMNINWEFIPKNNLGLGVSYVANQFIQGDLNNQKKMPSYTIADLRYSYQMKQIDFALIVKNLFDKSYYSYATTTGGYSVYPDFRRNIFASARYKF
jgi:iron complex outermembrane receptor protein